MQGVHRATPDQPLQNHAAAQHIGRREDCNGDKAMTFLKSLFPRRQSRREAELAYLNDAVSLYDLERREREIAYGKFVAR
jgi:hypothetical protein